MIKKTINPIDSASMAWIDAGEFRMGSEHEQPVHKVHLDGFWIYTHHVKNSQYLDFCKKTDRKPPKDPIPGYLLEYPDHPVVNVSWYDAQTYAKWANGRLPTEAEWEKAARGKLIDKIYPWGNEEPENRDFANYKYYKGKKADLRLPFDPVKRGPLPCGSFPPNGYGLFDMAGNVWDWVYDYYDPDYYYVSPETDPICIEEGTTRVRRGGDWARSALSLRCACRSSMPPESYDFRMGFRLVIPA
jgi:formylglycine-generating enzyme